MESFGTHYRALKWLVWSGPMLMATLFPAMLSSGFLPPPRPSASAEEIAALFRDNVTAIRVSCLVMIIGWAFFATFGAAMSAMVRRMEPGLPALSYASVAIVGGGLVFFELIPLTWSLIAYRPDSIPPDIMRLMNDFVWYVFVYTVPPFAAWFIIIGAAIFRDHNIPATYPRWVGFMNLWAGLILPPAILMAMFKTGPFAWNGIVGFWLPFLVFCGWMVVMVITTLQAINKLEARERATQKETAIADSAAADGVDLKAAQTSILTDV